MTGSRAMHTMRAAIAVLVPLLLTACAGSPEATLSTGLAPEPGSGSFSLASADPGGGHATLGDTGEDTPVLAEEAVDDVEAAATTSSGKTRIAMQPLPDVLPAARARTLSDSMKAMLAAHGYEVIDGPQEGDGIYRLAADIAIEKNGKAEKVGVDWTVSDALGNPLGKVSQSGTVQDKATDAQWGRQATLAAAAAAEGVVRIVSRPRQ